MPALRQSERRRPDLDNRLKEQQIDRLRLDNERTRLENDVRVQTSRGIFAVVVFWLTPLLVVVLLQAGPNATTPSDAVLVSLLATTTVDVLGLSYTVARYLFPQPDIGRRSRRPATAAPRSGATVARGSRSHNGR